MRPLFTPLALTTLVACVLAACAGSPQPLAPDASGPYAGIPHVAGDNMTAEAQPVAPTGDDRLDNFLADLAAAIDRHDWYGVAEFIEGAPFAERRAAIEAEREDGAAAQVIGETLGLSTIVDPTGGRPWKALGAVEVVTLRSVTSNTPGIAGGEATYTVDGDVRLASGEKMPIRFTVVSRDRNYKLQVPLG